MFQNPDKTLTMELVATKKTPSDKYLTELDIYRNNNI